MSAKGSDAGFIVWGEDRMPVGPVDVRELVSWVKTGHVTADTWVFVNRRAAWERAADLPDLQLFFQARIKELSAQVTHPRRIRGVDPRGLRRIPLLNAFTDLQLERFAHYLKPQRVPQGAVIVKQGDHGNSMFLIQEGNVTVRLNIAEVETELATLKTGDFFGDFALFDSGPRSADVIANSTCVLMQMPVTEFNRMCRESSDITTKLLRALAKALAARIRTGNKHRGEAVRIARMMG